MRASAQARVRSLRCRTEAASTMAEAGVEAAAAAAAANDDDDDDDDDDDKAEEATILLRRVDDALLWALADVAAAMAVATEPAALAI